MLNIGVIGTGHLGRHHARIYSEMADVRLVGVADLVESRAAEIAAAHGGEALTDFTALLERVDAVSVAVPTERHVEVGVRCLDAGVHVLVEKPIAPSVEGADRLIDAATRNDRVLQVGHVERFNPVVQAASTVATRPQFFEVHRLNTFSLRGLDVDVVLDLMIHDIDIILSLVDAPVSEVRAVGIPVLSSRADIANVRIEFSDGCVANLTASRVSTERVRKLRFFQPHDYLSLDYETQEGVLLSLEGGRIHSVKLDPGRRIEPLRAQLESFLASVRGDHPPLVSGPDGRRALEIALRVNDEIEAHRRRGGASSRET
jgi:predicted dehydrogenase